MLPRPLDHGHGPASCSIGPRPRRPLESSIHWLSSLKKTWHATVRQTHHHPTATHPPLTRSPAPTCLLHQHHQHHRHSHCQPAFPPRPPPWSIPTIPNTPPRTTCSPIQTTTATPTCPTRTRSRPTTRSSPSSSSPWARLSSPTTSPPSRSRMRLAPHCPRQTSRQPHRRPPA